MKSYKDENNMQVFEIKLDFLETGGYDIKIQYKSKNFIVKILYFFGLIKFMEPIIEIENEELNSEYIEAKRQKDGFGGISFVRKGEKTLRFAVPRQTVALWDLKAKVNRVSN